MSNHNAPPKKSKLDIIVLYIGILGVIATIIATVYAILAYYKESPPPSFPPVTTKSVDYTKIEDVVSSYLNNPEYAFDMEGVDGNDYLIRYNGFDSTIFEAIEIVNDQVVKKLDKIEIPNIDLFSDYRNNFLGNTNPMNFENKEEDDLNFFSINVPYLCQFEIGEYVISYKRVKEGFGLFIYSINYRKCYYFYFDSSPEKGTAKLKQWLPQENLKLVPDLESILYRITYYPLIKNDAFSQIISGLPSRFLPDFRFFSTVDTTTICEKLKIKFLQTGIDTQGLMLRRLFKEEFLCNSILWLGVFQNDSPTSRPVYCLFDDRFLVKKTIQGPEGAKIENASIIKKFQENKYCSQKLVVYSQKADGSIVKEFFHIQKESLEETEASEVPLEFQ